MYPGRQIDVCTRSLRHPASVASRVRGEERTCRHGTLIGESALQMLLSQYLHGLYCRVEGGQLQSQTPCTFVG